jgi:urea transport system ATP-binding protein
LADAYAVLDRGEVVLSGSRKEMEETAIRRYLTV